MKNFLLYSTTFFLFSCSTTLFAQTQLEMNETAINNFKKADDKLNQVYKNLIKKLDEKEKSLLIAAQKNWIKFRDSKCDFEKQEYDGGSIQPLIYYTCLTECTEERTKGLKRNLTDRESRYGTN
ncbi:lysozyme inhibitor LprI family protein [Flavobacterium sp. KACC 22761]|uniref:lysozyme inhibitor LprI family protein n=1 Tax=Flavobacterium sp. KACC 22761 TaxID=3092665 RepID=UPI002A758509|nr:lysozyme inhibitor LprI family protein [Flavobacterium sp. KACC 22761]WPO77191.1 lysozyme inhibitor LprI family protein [Flavobacterium sp. KACC 22761]